MILKTGLMYCPKCGRPFLDENFRKVNPVYQLMAKKKICYNCAYWELFRLEDDMEIIQGIIYRILPPQKPEPGVTLGIGKMRYILKKDMTVKKSNDIWKVAEIPLRYRVEYPDTAWWVSKVFHDKWGKYKYKCNARGCLDRYHCFRYDIKREYEKGPFNKVPRDWINGNEHCRYFINILDIKRYDDLIDINDLLFNEQSLTNEKATNNEETHLQKNP